MGIKLDDIVGNKNNHILEDKSKKTMNRLIIVIAIIVVIIVILAIKVMSESRKKQLRDETEKLLNDATTLSQAVSQRYLMYIQNETDYRGNKYDLLGLQLTSDGRPGYFKTINFGGQEIKFEGGYYYLTSAEVNELAPNLNLKDLEYVVNYNTGEVVSLRGINYNGKNYYFQEDLQAINDLLNQKEAYIPSDYTIFVNTPQDLFKLKDYPEYIFKLCSNIDMAEYKGDAWPSIVFGGSFDGRNYTISNLTIDRPSDEKVGFFSELKSGAVVKNLSLDNVNVNGGRYTGSIAGVLNSKALVQNSATWSGTVSSASDYAGGLFGQANGEVIEVMSRCNVDCGGKCCGGFAGEIVGGKYEKVGVKNRDNGRVEIIGSYNIGGFAGLLNPLNDVEITEACSYANIYAGSNERASIGLIDEDDKAFNYNAGGFIGAIIPQKSQLKIVIDSAYSRGKIERCDRNLGGFVGAIAITGIGTDLQLKHIYAAVDTNADCKDQESRGGFVGYVDTGKVSGQTSGVFWRKDNLVNMDLANSGIGRSKSTAVSMTFNNLTTEGLRVPSNYSWDNETLKKWKFYEARYGVDSSENLPTLAWE